MITYFTGKYRFLSNFYPAHIEGKIDSKEVVYISVEHAYQAAKTLYPEQMRTILACQSAGEAKKVGKKLTLRDDWEAIKLDVMWGLLRLKFVPTSYLANQLLATEDQILVEGNDWHDTYWGKCFCVKHMGMGENHLGELLMKLRKELNNEM